MRLYLIVVSRNRVKYLIRFPLHGAPMLSIMICDCCEIRTSDPWMNHRGESSGGGGREMLVLCVECLVLFKLYANHFDRIRFSILKGHPD